MVEECTAWVMVILRPAAAQGAAFVHAHHLGNALFGQDLRQFVDGHHRGPGLLGQRHRLAHVIPMAVGHQDEVHLAHLLHRGIEQGVAEPGVDEHGNPAPGQFKGRMAKISDAHPASDKRLSHGSSFRSVAPVSRRPTGLL